MSHSPAPGIARFSPVFLTLEDPAAPPRLPRLHCEEREALRSFFGFKTDPFPGEDEPSCIRGSPQHERCLERLGRGIRDGIPLGVVTGRAGLGRGSVARLLRDALPVDSGSVLEVRIEPGLGARAFLKGLLRELGLERVYREERPLPDLLSLLKDTIRAAHQEEVRRLVLLLLDAHRVDAGLWPVLKAISDIGSDRKAPVTILLFGEEALREELQRPDLASLRQRVFVHERLRALTAQETGDYIRKRLDGAGCEGRPFGPGTCDAIHRAAAGVPRDVNAAAANALVRAFRRRKRVVGPEEVQAARSRRA